MPWKFKKDARRYNRARLRRLRKNPKYLAREWAANRIRMRLVRAKLRAAE